jgi:hypothetical protein
MKTSFTKISPAIVLVIVGLSALKVAFAQTEATTAPLGKITAGPPRMPCAAIIHDGFSLTGDGLGVYQDNVADSSVYQIGALSIVAWKHLDLLSNKPRPTAKGVSQRSMAFDLSRPVEGSGAIKLQATKDELARFHVFWRYDEAPSGTSIDKQYFPRDIPIGTAVESDRVEMWVRLDGVQHVLQMGPWAMGRYTPRAAINGGGTTRATITRETESSWRVKAPDRSLVRLWDYSDIQRPIDKGLYHFSFDVAFRKLR